VFSIALGTLVAWSVYDTVFARRDDGLNSGKLEA